MNSYDPGRSPIDDYPRGPLSAEDHPETVAAELTAFFGEDATSVCPELCPA